MNDTRPIIIAIEGPDGVGKTTHVKNAVEHLRAYGIAARAFHHTRPHADCIVLAARGYAWQRSILLDGMRDSDVVIANRWYWSTYAASASVPDDQTEDALIDIARAERDSQPGHCRIETIVLDAPSDVLDARLSARGEMLPDDREYIRRYYRDATISRRMRVDTTTPDALDRSARLIRWAVDGLRMGALW